MESERCVVLVFPFSTFFWLLIVMVEDSELTVLFDSLRYLSPAAAFADGHTTTTDGYDNDIDNRYQNDPTKDKKLEGDIRSPRYFSLTYL